MRTNVDHLLTSEVCSFHHSLSSTICKLWTKLCGTSTALEKLDKFLTASTLRLRRGTKKKSLVHGFYLPSPSVNQTNLLSTARAPVPKALIKSRWAPFTESRLAEQACQTAVTASVQEDTRLTSVRTHTIPDKRRDQCSPSLASSWVFFRSKP